MKVTALCPVRNEDWVLGLSARAVLRWVDSLVILNHASTDGTQAILDELQSEYGDRLSVLTETDPQWNEMAHRQRMLEHARSLGATHLALVDADEVLTGNLLPTIRGMIESAPPGSILQLPWLCLRGSIDRCHVGGIWGHADVSTAFQDEPRCHWAARDGYDFHHRHPMGRHNVTFRPFLHRDAGLMHLQFVSDRRLRAKQLLYCLTERLRWPNREPVDVVRRRYSVAVYGAENPTKQSHELRKVPAEWWAPYADLMKHLKPDAEPWQEIECKRLLAEHGTKRFKGLDLFGVTA